MDSLIESLFREGSTPGALSFLAILFYATYKGLSFVLVGAVDFFKTKDKESKEETAELKLANAKYQKDMVEHLKEKVAELENRIHDLERDQRGNQKA